MTLLADAIELFFVARAPKKHSAHTSAAYRADFAAIAGLVADEAGTGVDRLEVADLTLPALRNAFAAISDKSAATLARRWSAWNQLFTFLVSEEITAGNPMAGVARPKVPASRPKPVGGDDSVSRLLQVAARGRARSRHPWPERDLAAVVLLLACGLRLSELVSLRVGSIEGPEGERVLGVRGKGSKERTLPVEPEVEAIVASYLQSRYQRFGVPLRPQDPLLVSDRGGVMQRGSVQYLIAELYREAGIRNQVPRGALVHALRHTFATSLAHAGANATELRVLLGHESLATTQRYIDATAREVRAAARTNPVYADLRRLGPGPQPR